MVVLLNSIDFLHEWTKRVSICDGSQIVGGSEFHSVRPETVILLGTYLDRVMNDLHRGRSPFSHLSHPNPNPNSYPNLTLTLNLTPT